MGVLIGTSQECALHPMRGVFVDFPYSLSYIVKMPSEVRFAEVRKTLEAKGYSLVRISGSHHIFSKPGIPRPVVISVHDGKVKYGYVRDIQKLP